MIKKTLALILTAVVLLSGCSNSGGTAQTTTESTAAPSEAWEYEFYIEDLDYFMNQYLQNYDSARNAFANEDGAAVRNYLENVLEALNSLESVIYPPDLEEVHSKFLFAVGLQKELAECNTEISYYIGDTSSLTSDDYSELNNLNSKGNSLLSKIRDGNDIQKAWINVKNAAFANLPNGEYKAYVSTLEILWQLYIVNYNRIYDVLFNNGGDDIQLLYENCLETLSEIENMEVPEQLKLYHDDIIAAIPYDREYLMTVKSLKELIDKYQATAPEDAPADVRSQIEKYSEIIYNYPSEDNTEYFALYNAVITALDFADAQAGQ